MRGRILGVICVIAAIVATPSAVRRAAAVSRPCLPVWRAVAAPDPGMSNVLYGVDARTEQDGWAVGTQSADDQTFLTLVERWNGATWTVVPSANSSSDTNILYGVSALAPDDVWAVGRKGFAVGLIEHFDGRKWRIVPAAPTTGLSYLDAVRAFAPDDVWAVGFDSPAQRRRELIEHWDGKTWSRVAVPPVVGNNYLFALTGTSARDLWTVGSGFHDPVAIHWNGRAWKRSSVPTDIPDDGFLSASAVGRNDVWAGGTGGIYLNDTAVMAHWNGRAWSLVDFPQLGSGVGSEGQGPLNQVQSVGASSTDDVWAVGDFQSRGQHKVPLTSFAAHYDGTSWVAWPRVAAANPWQVIAFPDGHAWSVGWRNQGRDTHSTIEQICPIVATASGFAPKSVAIDLGETVAWKIDPTATGPLTIRDSVGLLVASPRAPGGSLTYGFSIAARYRVVVSAASATATARDGAGTIAVAPTATPRSTIGSQPVTVQWATATPPQGFVIDAQIERPGATHFVDLLRGTRRTSTSFVADAGAGSYRFRTRVRRVDGSSTSGYSPPVSVRVG